MNIAVNPKINLNNFDEVLFDKTISLFVVEIRITNTVDDNGKKQWNLDFYTK